MLSKTDHINAYGFGAYESAVFQAIEFLKMGKSYEALIYLETSVEVVNKRRDELEAENASATV